MVTGLQAKGVQFEKFGFFEQDELGIWSAPSGDSVAWFKDPDGNVLSVHSTSDNLHTSKSFTSRSSR
jgi:hypothetical protein